VRFESGVCYVGGTVASQEDREKVILACGNVVGVARVEDSIEVENPKPGATLYTVQSGDTLSKIAKAHYGDASKYPVIFEANRPLLEDPDKIYPGQVLRIPKLD
jgi:nucleoid-associated protein YgaU